MGFMTPYQLVTFWAKFLNRPDKPTPATMCLAKKALTHLNALHWQDSDISIVLPLVCNNLINRGIFPSFNLVCSLLLKTKDTITFKSVSLQKQDDWIQQELERLNAIK